MNVALLGASENPNRFAYKAMTLLLEKKHNVVLVNPKLKKFNHLEIVADLDQLNEKIDTLTMYVSPKISSELTDKILRFNPSRIIFNPGSENSEIEPKLRTAGIQIVKDCTLVMLNSGRF